MIANGKLFDSLPGLNGRQDVCRITSPPRSGVQYLNYLPFSQRAAHDGLPRTKT